MNRYTIIDETTWKRAQHCAVFRNCIEPSFCVTFDLDVTNFRRAIGRRGLSFTLALVYAVTECANSIEEFRYRFLNGNVVLFDKIDTAFTWLDADTELFKVVNVPFEGSMDEYVAAAKRAAEQQKVYFTGPLGIDVFQFSPLPWVTYRHISHTNAGNRENSTPLFDWGRFYEREGRYLLPFSVQVHHSFADGLHVGRLAEKVQDLLNRL